MIYLVLFATFFIIGLFSFGGGAGMLALIEQEVVVHHGWMSSAELFQFVGIAESTPGPIAVNIATSVGFQQAGILGGICATLGVVMPSFIVILIISIFFNKLIKSKFFQIILNGVKPIILGLIVIMVIKICCLNIFTSFSYDTKFQFNWQPLVITIILIGIYVLSKVILKKKIPPILLICISIILGILIYS